MTAESQNKAWSRREFFGVAAGGLAAAGIETTSAEAQTTEEPFPEPEQSQLEAKYQFSPELSEKAIARYLENLSAIYSEYDSAISNEKLPEEAHTALSKATESFLKQHSLAAGVSIEFSTPAVNANAFAQAIEYMVFEPRETPLDPRVLKMLARQSAVTSQDAAEKSLALPGWKNELEIDPKSI